MYIDINKNNQKVMQSMKQHIEDINSGKIAKANSLNSLVNSGICNKDGGLAYPYNGGEPRGLDFSMREYNGNLLKLTK